MPDACRTAAVHVEVPVQSVASEACRAAAGGSLHHPPAPWGLRAPATTLFWRRSSWAVSASPSPREAPVTSAVMLLRCICGVGRRRC